ncbi:MAG: OmpH family outer membrane protein [Bacteroidota bacterium]
MKKAFTFVLLAAVLLTTGIGAHAQNKIGHIALSDIILAMPEAKKADTALQQFRDALYQSAQDKNAAFDDAVAKFYKDSSAMTVSVKEVKRKALQQQMQDMQGEEQRIQEELRKKQEEYSAPIQKKALDAVQVVAKENGYTYVFVKEALLVSPPSDDLAPLVKKKLGLK